MKKFRLRRWVKVALTIIAIMSALVMMSECEDTIMFIFSHILAGGIFVSSTSLLMKNSRENDLYEVLE